MRKILIFLTIILTLALVIPAFAGPLPDYSWNHDGKATLGRAHMGWKQLFLGGSQDAMVFDGATLDNYSITFRVTDPTAARIITFPNSSGTVALSPVVEGESGGIWYGTNSIIFEGTNADVHETTLTVTEPTADVIYEFPTGTAGTYYPIVSTLATNQVNIANSIWGISNGLAMGGATGGDGFELQLKPMGDPAADKYILFPVLTNAASMISSLTTNDVNVANSIWGVSNGIAFGGATGADGFETTLTVADPGADYTITLPAVTGTVALRTGEITTATDVLTFSECGKMIFLNSGTEYSTTLPALSTVSAGCQFEFIIKAAASGANYTILTGNSLENKIYGSMEVAGAVVACADEDTITLVDGNAVGDWVKVRSDGTNWYITGSTVTTAKATCTQAD